MNEAVDVPVFEVRNFSFFAAANERVESSIDHALPFWLAFIAHFLRYLINKFVEIVWWVLFDSEKEYLFVNKIGMLKILDCKK